MVHGDGRQLACEGGRTQRFLSRQPHDLAPVPRVRDDFHGKRGFYKVPSSCYQPLSQFFPIPLRIFFFGFVFCSLSRRQSP
jgi:hypothetical protein